MSVKELFEILLTDKPSEILLAHEKELFELVPDLKPCKGFDQNTKWHVYDVYGHIMHVVDNVENDLVLRVAALFHDVGKPPCYYEDSKGTGHFKGHWVVSEQMFDSFAKKHHLNEEFCNEVKEIILFHDIRVPEMSEESIRNISEALGPEKIKRLYQFKRADLKAMNKEFHYVLGSYDTEEDEMIKMANEGKRKSY